MGLGWPVHVSEAAFHDGEECTAADGAIYTVYQKQLISDTCIGDRWQILIHMIGQHICMYNLCNV